MSCNGDKLHPKKGGLRVDSYSRRIIQYHHSRSCPMAEWVLVAYPSVCATTPQVIQAKQLHAKSTTEPIILAAGLLQAFNAPSKGALHAKDLECLQMLWTQVHCFIIPAL